MSRLPYGAYSLMTPEEQREHRNALHRKWARKNSEYLNTKNKRYFDRWRKEKPFVVNCVRCGKEFNVARKSRQICDECHNFMHNLVDLRKKADKVRRDMKVARDELVLKYTADGMLQKEIASMFGVTQKTISNICMRNGIRKQKHHRKK